MAISTKSGELLPGTILNTSFKVLSLIGSGGMGDVYLCQNLTSNKSCAIKRLKPALEANPRLREAIIEEANALQMVKSPAIVGYQHVFTDGEKTGSSTYIVMEYVDGMTLEERLASGPLSVAETQILGRRLAMALTAVHEQRLIHRDIAPDNIRFRNNSVAGATLIDFGLASGHDTSDGAFEGKLLWTSPEQLGMFNAVVGPKADDYSAGLVLACAATGRALPMGTTKTGARASRMSVPDLSGLPPDLRRPIAALLEPDPARRASLVEGMFDASGPREQTTPPKPTLWERMAALLGSWAIKLAGGAALVIVFYLAFLFLRPIIFHDGDDPDRPPASGSLSCDKNAGGTGWVIEQTVRGEGFRSDPQEALKFKRSDATETINFSDILVGQPGATYALFARSMINVGKPGPTTLQMTVNDNKSSWSCEAVRLTLGREVRFVPLMTHSFGLPATQIPSISVASKLSKGFTNVGLDMICTSEPLPYYRSQLVGTGTSPLPSFAIAIQSPDDTVPRPPGFDELCRPRS